MNLPYHGGTEPADDIALAIHMQIPEARAIIGYSAGGRVALELKERWPENYGKLILLSTQLEALEEEVKERERKEQKWIELLCQGDIHPFLDKWYQQPLFSSLRKKPIYKEMLLHRASQNPLLLSEFMAKYSICKKAPPKAPASTIYLYGEEDLKYAQCYRKLPYTKNVYGVINAGHAIHIENPTVCAKIIAEAIHEHH